jgi:excisionase family DNA binding protein
MTKMLTVTQAAQEWGVKPATVRSWIWKRQVEYVKVSRAVRIPAAEIDRVIENGTRPAIKTTGFREIDEQEAVAV